MKNRSFKSLNEFVVWLNGKYEYVVGGSVRKFKSGKMYGKYIEWGLDDLGIRINDFTMHSSPGLVKAYLKRLNKSQAFLRRSKKEQSDIISAFKAFILFAYTVSI